MTVPLILNRSDDIVIEPEPVIIPNEPIVNQPVEPSTEIPLRTTY